MIHNKVRGFNFPEFFQLVVGNIWGEIPTAIDPGAPSIAFQDMDLIISSSPLDFHKGSAFRFMVEGLIDENTYDVNPNAFPFTTAPIIFQLFDTSFRTKTVFFNEEPLFVFNNKKSFTFKIQPQLHPAENKVHVLTTSGLSSRVFTFSAYNVHFMLSVAAKTILDQRVELDSIRHNFILTPESITNEIGE